MAAREHSVTSRLKREDCNRTKHDSVFSNWKILIGPSDWENHSLGKEGTERYRIHNLPSRHSGSGLYELGITKSTTDLGRDVRKLDPDRVIVVYLGQADSVRTRLQDYGRAGSHLDCSNSISLPSEDKCSRRRLFREIFSSGYSIVFRWVPMDNKKDAENTEARLLNCFDYAWNKGSNGARRPDDILVKLDKGARRTTLFPSITRKLQHRKWNDPFNQKKEGIKIKASKQLLTESVSSTYTDPECDDHDSRIIKFGRSRPRLVSNRCVVNADSETICGVALGDGSVCRRQPVEGRKRCEDHKGWRINVSTSKLVAGGKSNARDPAGLESPYEQECDDLRSRITIYGRLQPRVVLDRYVVKKEDLTICGVALGDGSVCRRQPVEGRKRCAEHKGRRTNGCTSDVRLEFNPHSDWGGDDRRSQNFTLGGSQPQLGFGKHVVSEDLTDICGAPTVDGPACRRRPSEGGKRCWQHKGGDDGRSQNFILGGSQSQLGFGKCVVSEDLTDICGAPTIDGSACRRRPSGGKRCWQHKGGNDGRSQNFILGGSWSQLGFGKRVVSEDLTDICGAATVDGSACRRRPSEGGKRCWQHKGGDDRRSQNFTLGSSQPQFGFGEYVVSEDRAGICGAATVNGSACRRQTSDGRRCWQHKGGDDRHSQNFTLGGSQPQFGFGKYVVSEDRTGICGAATVNGSACRRRTSDGRRCWQH